jgi:uncharacterized membrane protein
MNPLSRLVAGLFAVLALAGALFFGVFVLAIVLGLGFIAWLVFWVRMTWLRRTQGLAGKQGGARDGSGRHAQAGERTREGDIIDAEYTVVSRRDDD